MTWRFFSGVTFVLFCFVFRLYGFVEAAALRSIVLRYAGVPIATRVSFFFFPFYFIFYLFVYLFIYLFIFICLFGGVAFSEYFLVLFPLPLCMESASCVLSFRMVFFYPVATGWIFDISLCESSIKLIYQSSAEIPVCCTNKQS